MHRPVLLQSRCEAISQDGNLMYEETNAYLRVKSRREGKVDGRLVRMHLVLLIRRRKGVHKPPTRIERKKHIQVHGLKYRKIRTKKRSKLRKSRTAVKRKVGEYWRSLDTKSTASAGILL